MEKLSTATFAGGCFWCVVGPFKALSGVKTVLSGYAGGTEKNPTYEDVAHGRTNHREAVQVTYDPEKTSYQELLDTFWRQIDPFDAGGQFADRGSAYQTAIFYTTENQRVQAEQSKEHIAKRFGEVVMTQILPFTTFFPAEEEHQDFYKKHPRYYAAYKRGSGREGFINSFWN